MAAFSSPVTRMLLASEGLTTTLLQAAAGSRVRPEVVKVSAVPTAGLPALVRRVLRAEGVGRCLLRRTRLAAADGRPVSDNIVVARKGVDPRLDTVLHGPGSIGLALRDAGFRLERRILHVGRGVWPGPGSLPCACKVYVLEAGGPLVYVQELFHPQLVPADRVSAAPSKVQA
ncbi:hypothetical protein [Streptomyces subrutilus]|uniref:hypothetical protein n=1 Tax=Streptomyces subrutilus TaxID=36818 RepID=UPI0033F02F85